MMSIRRSRFGLLDGADGPRMHVVAIGDHAHPGVASGERRPHQAGPASRERRHGIEQVSDATRASLEVRGGLLVGRVRMTEKHDDPGAGQRLQLLGARSCRAIR